jgi:hypothetical protein
MVNTEQAFKILKDAGVTEDVSIDTVRRWLRERKITYEGTGHLSTGYILEDTDQAINMLKDAGVTESTGTQIIQRWLREGKIQNIGTRKRKSESLQTEPNPKWFLNNPGEQDKMIRQLQVRIKAQDEHIKGIEKLHQDSINALIQQRNKLKKEIINQELEFSELQRETKKLLKENINLHNELIKLKEELTKGNKIDSDKTEAAPPPSKPNDYRYKLGLSKTANQKEVLSGFKKLLILTHPDHGGNAATFHYIKVDYDNFRKS